LSYAPKGKDEGGRMKADTFHTSALILQPSTFILIFLLNNLCHHARTDRLTPFANCEADSIVHGDRLA